jgi:hypothetical protein
LRIDPLWREVLLGKRQIELSAKPFALRTLAAEPTRVFTKDGTRGKRLEKPSRSANIEPVRSCDGGGARRAEPRAVLFVTWARKPNGEVVPVGPTTATQIGSLS